MVGLGLFCQNWTEAVLPSGEMAPAVRVWVGLPCWRAWEEKRDKAGASMSGFCAKGRPSSMLQRLPAGQPEGWCSRPDTKPCFCPVWKWDLALVPLSVSTVPTGEPALRWDRCRPYLSPLLQLQDLMSKRSVWFTYSHFRLKRYNNCISILYIHNTYVYLFLLYIYDYVLHILI